MTDRTPDRRAELIAAALASELTPTERVEFDALRADDPTIDEELALLGGLPAEVRAIGAWQEARPSDALRDRISLIDQSDRADPSAPGDRARTTRTRDARRPLPLSLAAAACVAIGVGGGVALSALQDAPVSGPPGTLGAIEAVSFEGEPAGVDIVGDVVAHTWGTETVLRVDGLPTGGLFSIVVIDETGREFSSGTLLGSDVPIDCSLNAAVLREDVVAVEIRDAEGARIATAAVSPVDA